MKYYIFPPNLYERKASKGPLALALSTYCSSSVEFANSDQQLYLLSNHPFKYFIKKLVAVPICLVHIQLQWPSFFYGEVRVTFQTALNFSPVKLTFYGIFVGYNS